MSAEIYPLDCRLAMRLLMAPNSVHTCVTSPPYFGLRDYGHAGQIGLEPTPDEYVAALVEVFREVRRVLRDDGTVWLNLGDSYAGAGPSGSSYQSKTTIARSGQKKAGNFSISKSLGDRGLTYANKKPIAPAGLKSKDLIGIPWRVAFALQADGWYLRQDIIWHKPNPMPESVRDRCTKAHEYIFLLSKSEKYYFDQAGITEPTVSKPSGNKERKPASARGVPVDTNGQTNGAVAGSIPWEGTTRNKRSVWTVTTKPFPGAHFATFPPDLITPCVLAGSPVGGTVLDPFGGAGTTALVAQRHGRNSVSCELNGEYIAMAQARLNG